jgi:hypothetical protein
MPRSPLYGLMPHQVIGGFQWRVHWWVLGWYNLHALVEKGCPFIKKNGLKKQMDGLNTSPPAICPPAFNEGRETICSTCYKTSWWTYITISVLGSVGSWQSADLILSINWLQIILNQKEISCSVQELQCTSPRLLFLTI